MRTIHKFDLELGPGEFEVLMPRNANILCVEIQESTSGNSQALSVKPRVWAVVDDEQCEVDARHVTVVGTGWELPADIGRSEYIGTYQTAGRFVWHVFVTKPNALSGESA